MPKCQEWPGNGEKNGESKYEAHSVKYGTPPTHPLNARPMRVMSHASHVTYDPRV